MRENRIKEVVIDERLIVDMLNAFRHHQMITLPVTDELPEGTEVVRVTYDFGLRALLAHVHHPSFQSTPLTAYPERVGNFFTVETLELVPLPLRVRHANGSYLPNSQTIPPDQIEVDKRTGTAYWKKPEECDVIADLNAVRVRMELPEFPPKEIQAYPGSSQPEVPLPTPTTEVETTPQTNTGSESDFFFDGKS